MPSAPSIRCRLLLLGALFCLGAGGVLVAAVPAAAQPSAAAGPDAAPGRVSSTEALQDSLRREIRQYRAMIESLSDSLAERPQTPGNERWLEETEEAIESLGETIGSLAEQLSAMQVEIEDGQFSLSDGRGGRVTVAYPSDLGERISQGIASISQAILEDLPDTLRISAEGVDYARLLQGRIPGLAPPPPPPRRVIRGDVFKFNDELEIAADEVVEGDVLALFGDVRVQGTIKGDLVAVLGDVVLLEKAAVEGQVVLVLGSFTRSDEASTGGLTVIDPGRSEGLFPRGGDRRVAAWSTFGAWQAMFLLVMGLVLLLLALLPRRRLDAALAVLTGRTAGSIGLGLLLAVFGHLAVIGLCALLVLTVIGIPVALLAILALALLDLTAVGLACLGLGRRLCAAVGWDCVQPWQAALLGLLVLHVPAFLAGLGSLAGLPSFLVLLLVWCGRLAKMLALAAGLGALFLGRFGSLERMRADQPVQGPVL